MILIFTNKTDVHADEVIRLLTKKNVDVFRLNTEDFLLNYAVNIYLGNKGNWEGVIIDEVGRELLLSQLRLAWLRKPKFDFLVNCKYDAGEYKFISSEAKALINILYSLPNVTWINDPFISDKGKSKFQQLLLARKLGLRTPRTLITTEKQKARDFFIECGNKEILIKSIYTGSVTLNGINQGVPARLINKSEFEKFFDKIHLLPTQFQEYIAKLFELRVTIIDDKVFAVKIDSQRNEKTKVDWRVHIALNPHSVFNLPKKIEKFCLDFLREQKLVYGAMDFIVTPDNEYVFLENNPFGQYLWLETETGIPLTEAMCDLLIKIAGKSI